MDGAIFFDDRQGELAPLNCLRPSFAIRLGPLTTLERLSRGLNAEPAGLWVPDDLAELTRDRHKLPVNTDPQGDGPFYVINGRCPIPLHEIDALEPGQRLIEGVSEQLIAAKLNKADALKLLSGEHVDAETIELEHQVLLKRPWHARSVRETAIRMDLDMLMRSVQSTIPTGIVATGDQPIVIHPEANVYPNVVFCAEDGPILVAPGAVIRPGAVINGPAFIGEHSTVLEQTIIRQQTSLGPVCKVAGEVGGTVFQGFANKAHHGYLGDSWVGEWVNLGAGTTTSNLLNTYGEIVARVHPDAQRERTGETFLGAIIGDHVKTAINTSIMTGSVLHVGGMFAHTEAVSGATPRFVWATDRGPQPFRLDKFLEIARAVMSRRDIDPSEAYFDQVRKLHAETFGVGPADAPATHAPNADAS